MTIPQYTQPANINALAAQQTIDTQQKQALMLSLKGGADTYQTPNMGATNPQTQDLATKVAGAMAVQQSQAFNDQRYKGGRRKRKTKKYTNKHRKRNKRKTKRRYTKR